MINRKSFYDSFRVEFGAIKQGQVNGFEAIFNQADKQNTSVKHLAYMLATSWHETAFTMKPIEEYGKGKSRPYGKKQKLNGNTYTDTDQIFYGRGFVQLTWYENYQKATQKLGHDFIHNASDVMQMDFATRIMFVGMAEGWFTGRKLSDYFNSTKNDALNARKIINGLDCAEKIKGYYNKFLEALS